MDKKSKKRLDVINKKLQTLRPRLAGSKQQADDPEELKQLEDEIAKLEANSTALVDAATAEVEIAQIKVDTLNKLRVKNPQEVLRAEADLLIAKARLKAEEENKLKAGQREKQITAEIERRSIRSPFAGVVVDVDRDISEFLSPNDKPVVHIVQLDRLRINVQLSSKYGKKIKPGMKMIVLLKDQAVDSAEGTVEFVDAIDDSASGTFRISFVIENSDMKIRPGSDGAVLIPMKLVEEPEVEVE